MALNPDIFTAVLIFIIGFACLLSSRNMIRMIIGIEIMARAATYSFIYFGFLNGNTSLSQAAVITVIVVEVVVSATALALIMNIYKSGRTLDVRRLTKLKG
ncbi:MAG: NADH-quinone oxidoreductase subunit K [Candidatus Saganbacteria bacterium]|nr:NADH-quinone oxidoreductase subunit K [Candidatus Saganbacteria bacterium]